MKQSYLSKHDYYRVSYSFFIFKKEILKTRSFLFKTFLSFFFVVYSINNTHAQYCTPNNLGDNSSFHITNITVGSIDNASNGTASNYEFYSATTDLNVNQSYSVDVDFATNSYNTTGLVLWIDFNNDGDFDDTGEQVYSATATPTTTSGTHSFSVTIPNTASIGVTRMRLSLKHNSVATSSCTNDYQAGEFEDYNINIIGISNSNPVATNDNLSVYSNSNSGTTNQIDVSTNDNIGTSNGTDGNDYSLNTNGTNGNVTEITDGIFEYIPDAGFVGTDSFTYQLCDAGGVCDSATVNVTVNYSFNHCTPTSTTNGSNYITNVSATGESGSFINNTTGDNGGYADFTATLPALEVYKNNTYTSSITVNGNNMGWAIYIDYNQDGDFNDTGELAANTGGEGTGNLNFTISSAAITGNTVMRVGSRRYWYSTDPCGNTDGQPEEFEDYLVDIQLNPTSPTEIDITGNGNIITDGSTTTSSNNFTNFGTNDIYVTTSRTYTITNNGSTDLNLTGSPIVSISGSTDFTISAQPSITTLSSGASTTFTVTFNPSVADPNTPVSAIISIDNNDADENPYNFVIQGYGDQTFPDTDGDGVPDNIDIDDDNDGLPDEYEQSSCILNPSGTTTITTYLNEDFGAGTDRKTTDGATYCYEDGTGSCNSNSSLNDGEYVVYYKAANGDGINNTPNGEVASWADEYWYPGLDHTTGDTNGRMAMFNAEADPGVFYETTITGVNSGVDITYGFSAINLDRADAPGISSRERPSVLIEILDPTDNIITSQSSGDIQPTSDYVTGDWVSVSATFSTTYTSFKVRLSNEAPGGLGNDLAIDDIFVYQELCDLDGDGVEDSIDLDNDDDGIPNVVELFLTDNDKDGTVNNDTGAYAWVDANSNGLIDIYDHQDANGLNPGDSGFSGSLGTPIDLTDPIYDTDGDGVVNYLDLDSDNDGVFDTVEYDNRGDVDVDGDGNGDGSDKEVLDSNGDPIDNDIYDGDGILNLADNNDDDGDDSDHGTANAYPTPLDDDGDGIPNYLDIDSEDNPNNFLNGSDIDTTEIYAHLDANNDGVIDGNTDSDGDGILDTLDTDNTIFGSPRDLDGSYTIFFDGRNDYIEDDNIINAWPSATLMTWIKIEPGASGQRVILGQDSFILRLENGNGFTAFVNGLTTTTSNLTEGVWIHVAASYDGINGTLNQYINGELINSLGLSGNLPTDTSNFTIGRNPNTDSNYFEGEIDEVRVFNAALTTDEIQKMVYQELDDTNTFDSGNIIPYNIATTFNTSLIKYYKMDTFKNDITDNKTTTTIDVSTGAKLYNIKNIYYQTAPLPYETVADGDWSTEATWLHGDVWDITDETNNKDWSIVHAKHNLTTSERHGTLGLIIDNGVKLEINNDVELQNSWYLNLEGIIDLQGESQLVQTENSTLAGTGVLERDQQGTVNLYTYNYWSSPVHTINPNTDIDGDESFSISSILLDGTDASNPQNFNFIAGYNGNESTNPIEISEYWMWKFVNKTSDNYYAWQQVKSTGQLNIGEGYTMKGYGSGAVSSENNYVFNGTPNNGTITLTTNAGNDYLVGNPYPSAIDGNTFILENTHTNGTLYFWEHFGGGSHVLKEYEGGYGQYNLSGGVPAVSHSDVSQSGTYTKTPERYIPVGQGFFITAISDGDTTFKNNQRIFVTESSLNSTFLKTTDGKNSKDSITDTRTKIRLNISSETGYTRQLLVTVDENATINADWGYDGALKDTNTFDSYWVIENEKYLIQGIDTINTTTTKLPLGVKSNSNTSFEIAIESVEYAPENMDIYIKDNTTNTYYNLNEASFSTSIEKEEVNNRFEIVFSKEQVLSTDKVGLITPSLGVYYNTQNKSIIINNINNEEIKALQLYNTLGQVIFESKIESFETNIIVPTNVSTGLYIAKVFTSNNETSKKMVINN